jgi:hypothetical protein
MRGSGKAREPPRESRSIGVRVLMNYHRGDRNVLDLVEPWVNEGLPLVKNLELAQQN